MAKGFSESCIIAKVELASLQSCHTLQHNWKGRGEKQTDAEADNYRVRKGMGRRAHQKSLEGEKLRGGKQKTQLAKPKINPEGPEQGGKARTP